MAQPRAAGEPAGAGLDPARVAGAFGLGRPRGPLAAVPGAWSNRLWRLETERGAFAVKELRGPAAAAGWRRRLRDAMALERAAWAAGTVPMAPPVAAADGGWLAEVATTGGGRATVRCHRWVAGTPAADLAPSWLWRNVDRCLGRRLDDPGDLLLAKRLAPRLVGSFPAEVATVDRWAGRLLEQP